MTVLKLLIQAREIISDPDMWYQGAYTPKAESTHDIEEGLMDPDIPCCAYGALRRAAGSEFLSDTVIEANTLLANMTPDEFWTTSTKSLAFYNDSPEVTHDDIMALFDAAIIREEKRLEEAAEKDAKKAMAIERLTSKHYDAEGINGA